MSSQGRGGRSLSCDCGNPLGSDPVGRAVEQTGNPFTLLSTQAKATAWCMEWKDQMLMYVDLSCATLRPPKEEGEADFISRC